MANTNGESFVFYKSFYSAFSALESIEHGKGSEYIEALCKFAFDSIVPETDDKIMQAFYDAFVPQLEANRIKKANGKKGRRKKEMFVCVCCLQKRSVNVDVRGKLAKTLS